MQRVPWDDPVRADSNHYKLEFENEYMRVLRVSYGAREKSVMHGHPDCVGIFLTDVHTRFKFPDGRTEDLQWKAGEVYWGFAAQHLPENLGNQRNEMLLFELKPNSPAAKRPALRRDPVQVDADHYNLELDSERVRVLRAVYGPHEKSDMHHHPPYAAAALTDAHCRFTYPNGRTEEVLIKAGQVVWFPAMEHQPENLSDNPFEAILVETKD
jgi:quercetin dioxygenase-like cupin family protein